MFLVNVSQLTKIWHVPLVLLRMNKKPSSIPSKTKLKYQRTIDLASIQPANQTFNAQFNFPTNFLSIFLAKTFKNTYQINNKIGIHKTMTQKKMTKKKISFALNVKMGVFRVGNWNKLAFILA